MSVGWVAHAEESAEVRGENRPNLLAVCLKGGLPLHDTPLLGVHDDLRSLKCIIASMMFMHLWQR